MSNSIQKLTETVSQLELKQKDKKFNYLINFTNIKYNKHFYIFLSI